MNPRHTTFPPMTSAQWLFHAPFFILARFPGGVRAWLQSVILLMLLPASTGAQHAHINAGAVSHTQNSALLFLNGDRFVATSGYVNFLETESMGSMKDWHYTELTFTALPSTPDFGGPAFGHAMPGSFLELRIEQVKGPRAGEFSFWETELDDFADEPIFKAIPGTPFPPFSFRLSEGQGLPGEDPHGHIHGRRFATRVTGLYEVGFRIVDTSSNGPDGGPWHSPSDLFPVYFQAGVTIHRIYFETDGNLILEFAAESGRTYVVERRSPDVDSDWSPAAPPLVGTGRLVRVELPSPHTPAAWFRLRRE
jgi:hypothetical protein